MNRNYLFAAVGVVVAGIALAFYLHGASIPVLEPQGPVAFGERTVILVTLALCAIIVVPVFFLLFYFAWKYRVDSPTSLAHHSPEWDHSTGGSEFFWWLVPSVIIALLSVLAWQSSHALDPYVPLSGSGAPMTVEVVALDWKWLFIYPEQGIASLNMLEIPENSPIHFEITADAPMNSFWIPALGGQIMAMPGMTTQLNLLADGTGVFRGLSGNLSGAGFAGMTFEVHSVSSGDFEKWVDGVKASSTPLTLAVYDALALPSENAPVAVYSPVDTNLYTTIDMRYMMPASEMATSADSTDNMGNMNDMNDMPGMVMGASTSTQAASSVPPTLQ